MVPLGLSQTVALTSGATRSPEEREGNVPEEGVRFGCALKWTRVDVSAVGAGSSREAHLAQARSKVARRGGPGTDLPHPAPCGWPVLTLRVLSGTREPFQRLITWTVCWD